MLGSAPYSVTKHGAVAFAEWLRATYGHRGIVVQAICPQGVRTRMLDEAGPLQGAAQPRPGAGAGGGRRRRAGGAAGRRVLRAAASRGGRLLPGPRRRPDALAGRHGPAAGQARRRERGHEGLAGGGRSASRRPRCASADVGAPRARTAGSSACGCSRRPANFPDVLLCRGEYQVRPELPFTPGVEACGEVARPSARTWPASRVGDRVVGTCVLPHGVVRGARR